MEWLHKIIFPVRRAWLAVSGRSKTRKTGGGLLKLHYDVQTCGYKDVQVMWEMLKKTETETTTNHKKHLRNFSWSSHGGEAPSSLSKNQSN